jgi:hypothetical protein
VGKWLGKGNKFSGGFLCFSCLEKNYFFYEGMSAEILQKVLTGWIIVTKENGGNRLHRL